MTLRAVLLAMLIAAPVGAQTMADQAREAAGDLQDAITGMQGAGTSRDRIAALTRTIRAYEKGLGALRDVRRQAQVRETQLTRQFDTGRARLSQLLGVLLQVEATPGPLVLLHPSGPLGTVRSGMILSEVTAGLQADAVVLKVQLAELRDIREVRAQTAEALEGGLHAAQEARTTLSQAISDRTRLPRRFTEDPEVLAALLSGAGTLDDFAAGLSRDPTGPNAPREFVAARRALPLPVVGTLLRRAGERDAKGTRRPGIAMSTRPGALVTAPAAGTIRYIGPLLDYGNVMILEPGAGYLLVLAGLGSVYGRAGEVVGADAPLGLMGSKTTGDAEFSAMQADGSSVRETETLYIEIRKGTQPVDPAEWFAITGATTGAATRN